MSVTCDERLKATTIDKLILREIIVCAISCYMVVILPVDIGAVAGIVLVVLAVAEAYACTAVIASGKATTDGRPFIFKNRDSSDGINNYSASK